MGVRRGLRPSGGAVPGLPPRRWWRVTAIGVEHPRRPGPALVVANQAGGQPWDAAMLPRHAPASARRTMRTRASSCSTGPSSCRGPRWRHAGAWRRARGALQRGALLGEGHLVMVFPEEAKGRGKAVERAATASSASGAAASSSSRSPAARRSSRARSWAARRSTRRSASCLAKLLGAPYLPITPTFPLLGPLGRPPGPGGSNSAQRSPRSRTVPDAAGDQALCSSLSTPRAPHPGEGVRNPRQLERSVFADGQCRVRIARGSGRSWTGSSR